MPFKPFTQQEEKCVSNFNIVWALITLLISFWYTIGYLSFYQYYGSLGFQEHWLKWKLPFPDTRCYALVSNQESSWVGLWLRNNRLEARRADVHDWEARVCFQVDRRTGSQDTWSEELTPGKAVCSHLSLSEDMYA